jgi:hypothetical protein
MSSQNPKRAIYEVLRRAQADRTLSQTEDARAVARFFLGVAVGINAVNKSVADPGVFMDMVRVAMNAWDRPAARRNGSAARKRPRPDAPQHHRGKKVSASRSVPRNSK